MSGMFEDQRSRAETIVQSDTGINLHLKVALQVPPGMDGL